jgi:hypothetical protein
LVVTQALKGRTLFKFECKERMAAAGVLAAISAVPISLGLAAADPTAHILWIAVGLAFWAVALALFFICR